MRPSCPLLLSPQLYIAPVESRASEKSFPALNWLMRISPMAGAVRVAGVLPEVGPWLGVRLHESGPLTQRAVSVRSPVTGWVKSYARFPLNHPTKEAPLQ